MSALPLNAMRDGRPAPPISRRIELIAAAVVLVAVAAYIGVGLRTAANTLGCDFLSYYNAVSHWLASQPIYDPLVTATGTCGIYQYPPPFVILALPFSLFGFAAGTWLWIAFVFACWLIGTALLPVRGATRWLVLLLGAVGWPLIFSIRIGQVTPVLYLVFALAWRSLDRPTALGAIVALGTMLKLQPAMLAVWLLARREWRALIVAVVVGVVIAAAAAIVGLSDWQGFLTLLRVISDAIDLPVNKAIGATVHALGVDVGLARTIQAVNAIAIVGLVVIAGSRLPRTPGFLVAIVATQLVSPIIWTHYPLILLLPVAWLLDRRQWWASLIPLVHAWVLIGIVPVWTYPLAFYATLAGLIVVGWRTRAAVAPVADVRMRSKPPPAIPTAPS
jgi:alpha-1,2-mannosyltransferase